MKKYLIAGLGNPGEKYADTRHNIGFVVLDAFAQKENVSFKPERYGDIARTKIKGREVILLKPSTFMNLSGKALRYWLEKENIPLENSLTVVDDIALPTGLLRMKKKGSDGGHNGLADIIRVLQTGNFPRLRIGVGDNFRKGSQIDFVLGTWTKKEEEVMIPKVKKATEMIKSFVAAGIERTMNDYNEKQPPPPSSGDEDNSQETTSE
ncbi:MAG: aminoacyl-tRNA hydrolase [Bacteroidales bacterium]|nr:aminoacyl-tRNA hydrolase [Bacteroidales bacterium]MCF8332530.1 aminoacyl-tRNA hydrolase [Bacteroidales bacterium]